MAGRTLRAIAPFQRKTAVEGRIFIATLALVLITWLLYKLVAWLEPLQ